jgi:hypothetical protein
MLRVFLIILLIIVQINCAKSSNALQDSIIYLSTEWSFEGYTSSISNIINDTIINSKKYKILRTQSVNIPGLFPNPWAAGYYDFYLRYDSINDIVYFLNGPFDQILYDYNMNIGDTLNHPMNPFILSTIDSVQLENLSYRKRFIFTDTSNFSIIWIKGIGNIAKPNDPIHIFDPTYIFGYGDFVLCYHENKTLIYQYQNLVPVQCDNYLPVNEIYNISNINIFPNPFKNRLNIDSSEEIEQIEVFDITGQKILIVSPKNQKVLIDLGNFNDGTYFLKIIIKNGKIIIRKIFKMF